MSATKKSGTKSLTLCNKCSGEMFRSELRHPGEMLIAPFILPFRCSRCGWRQFRSSLSRVKDKSNYSRESTSRKVT